MSLAKNITRACFGLGLLVSFPVACSTDCFLSGCPDQNVCKETTEQTATSGRCTSVPPPPEGCMAPC